MRSISGRFSVWSDRRNSPVHPVLETIIAAVVIAVVRDRELQDLVV